MDTEKRPKVLIIHHDDGAKCAYTAIARSAGWKVSSCEEAGDIAGAIRSDDFDVLIFDFSLEHGFQALRKAHRADSSLPTVLITAHPVDHAEVMNLGVKLILGKPPDATNLRESLAALAAPRPGSDFKVIFEFLERCGSGQLRGK